MSTVDIQNLTAFKSELDLKDTLWKNYAAQIKNYFGDEKKALKFLSSVVAAFQRNPKLRECTPVSVINSFMIMAQLELMPSDISGEAYVIPYNNKRNINGQWVKVMEAQFQLGYQGLVTLFYRSGAKDIAAEIVRKNDKFSYVNGVLHHEPDVFSDDRGEAIGAYVVVRLSSGGSVTKVMSAKEILLIGEKFSKSWSTADSPWKPENDPQLWTWKKTVLKQCGKLVPKNEIIVKAIDEDNKDSIIADRLEAAKKDTPALTMGALITDGKPKTEDNKKAPEGQNPAAPAEGAEAIGKEAGGDGGEDLPVIHVEE